MRHFVLSRPIGWDKPEVLLGVDPGIRTLGLCLQDITRAAPPKLWADELENLGVLSKAMPELLCLVSQVTRPRFVNIQSPLMWRKTYVVMESPHLGGEFSLGLGLVMSEIVRLLWLELKVAGIKFIPNNAAEFLQKKKSVSDTETKRYIQSLFPDIQFRKIKMHAVDALLFCLMGAPKFYKQILGIETRRLDVTVEQTHLIYG